MQSLPTITRNLLLINVLALLANGVFGMFMASQGKDLNSYLGLYYIGSPYFQIYQLVTYMFMHGGWVHLIFNMFALWMFGGIIERVWGPKKFLFYYLACGVGAGLIQEVVTVIHSSILQSGLSPEAIEMVKSEGITLLQNNTNFGISEMADLNLLLHRCTVGASGAIFGILLAFGMLFPNERLFIIPIPFPIKAKWLVIGYGALELVQAFGYNDGVAHFAHLGGMIFGYFLIRYWTKHPGRSGYHDNSDPFDKLRNAYGNWRKRQAREQSQRDAQSDRQQDWDYNARQRRKQEEIDRILDKIRKSGYDSLTWEEKQTLFDQSNKK